VLTVCVAGAARAQADVVSSTGSHRWSVQSAETVGPGANVGVFQAGFPGVDLMLIHGLDQTTDVNAHVGLNYAFEGLTTNSRFEFTAQVGIRKELLTFGGNVKMSGRFDPGIIIAASPGQFGLKIPLGLELGIPLSSVMIINASFDLPLYFTFGDFNAFYIPLLFGGGVEYLIQPNWRSPGRSRWAQPSSPTAAGPISLSTCSPVSPTSSDPGCPGGALCPGCAARRLQRPAAVVSFLYAHPRNAYVWRHNRRGRAASGRDSLPADARADEAWTVDDL